MRGQHPRHKSLFSLVRGVGGMLDDSRTTWPAEAHDDDNLSQTDRGSVCACVSRYGEGNEKGAGGGSKHFQMSIWP